ncbi:MAG: acyl-CoA thioesterase [Sedimentisphaeraceae bacterium JB056]
MKFPEKTTIQSIDIEIIPRYCETDQGGVVHHSVYPVYFEMGRTELLRANGLAYKDLEQAGFAMVVAELNLKYRRPAFYDEKLTLTTKCSQVRSAKIIHEYKLCRENDGQVLTEGTSILACIGDDGRPRRVPDFMYPED